MGAQPLVLHARAQPRQLAAVELGAGEAEQSQAQRDLQGGRRGEPRIARDLAVDFQIGAAECHARAQQLGSDPAHERAPTLASLGPSGPSGMIRPGLSSRIPVPERTLGPGFGRNVCGGTTRGRRILGFCRCELRGIGEGERVALIQVERPRQDAPLGGRPRPHRDALGDREREGEAAVVVGVLPDQVDPAGGEGAHLQRRQLSALPGYSHAAEPPPWRCPAPARSTASRSAAADSSGSVSAMNTPPPCSEPARYLSLCAVRSGG